MNPFIKRIFMILLTAFVVLMAVSFCLLLSFRNSNFYKSTYAFRNQHSTYDFIILGSSRGLTSINTRLLGQGLRQKGFNFSMDDSHIGTHELMLRHLLKNEIRFDTLFLVFENSLESVSSLSSNDYRFLPFIHTQYVRSYFRSLSSEEVYTAGDLFPFLPLAYYNIELTAPSVLALARPDFKYRFDEWGDYSYPVHGKSVLEESVTDVHLNLNNRQLKNIRAICDLKNIVLIILITPSYHTYFKLSGDLEDYNVLDISGTLGGSMYFYDRLHLNQIGKEKLTNILIEQLHKSNLPENL